MEVVDKSTITKVDNRRDCGDTTKIEQEVLRFVILLLVLHKVTEKNNFKKILKSKMGKKSVDLKNMYTNLL